MQNAALARIGMTGLFSHSRDTIDSLALMSRMHKVNPADVLVDIPLFSSRAESEYMAL